MKRRSFEMCFVPGIDYRHYIAKFIADVEVMEKRSNGNSDAYVFAVVSALNDMKDGTEKLLKAIPSYEELKAIGLLGECKKGRFYDIVADVYEYRKGRLSDYFKRARYELSDEGVEGCSEDLRDKIMAAHDAISSRKIVERWEHAVNAMKLLSISEIEELSKIEVTREEIINELKPFRLSEKLDTLEVGGTVVIGWNEMQTGTVRSICSRAKRNGRGVYKVSDDYRRHCTIVTRIE